MSKPESEPESTAEDPSTDGATAEEKASSANEAESGESTAAPDESASGESAESPAESADAASTSPSAKKTAKKAAKSSEKAAKSAKDEDTTDEAEKTEKTAAKKTAKKTAKKAAASRSAKTGTTTRSGTSRSSSTAVAVAERPTVVTAAAGIGVLFGAAAAVLFALAGIHALFDTTSFAAKDDGTLIGGVIDAVGPTKTIGVLAILGALASLVAAVAAAGLLKRSIDGRLALMVAALLGTLWFAVGSFVSAFATHVDRTAVAVNGVFLVANLALVVLLAKTDEQWFGDDPRWEIVFGGGLGSEPAGIRTHARSLVAIALIVVGIVYIAMTWRALGAFPPETWGEYALFGEAPTRRWVWELDKWNYAIGFGAILIGLIVSAHRSTPLGRGNGVVVGMLLCFGVGLVWICTFYLFADSISDIWVLGALGQWNLVVGIAFFAVGFSFATKWE